MRNPQEVVNGSIMPSYGWMYKEKINFGLMSKKLSVMKSLGVPYGDEDVINAESWAREEAKKIADGLNAEGAQITEDREIIALIAYLQKLGTVQGVAGGAK
jgi:cytochrome c oxidase cbb3-type subunit I/II